MSDNPAIEFVLHDKVEGVELTPRTIGLSQFIEFNQQGRRSSAVAKS